MLGSAQPNKETRQIKSGIKVGGLGGFIIGIPLRIFFTNRLQST